MAMTRSTIRIQISLTTHLWASFLSPGLRNALFLWKGETNSVAMIFVPTVPDSPANHCNKYSWAHTTRTASSLKNNNNCT